MFNEGIGITNQRETTVVWDKVTGEPLHNAIGRNYFPCFYSFTQSCSVTMQNMGNSINGFIFKQELNPQF